MVLKSPKVVSFDLDDTLLDNSGIPEVVRRLCELVASRTGVDLATVTAADAEVFSLYFRQAESRLALGALSGAQMLADVWSEVLERCGCRDPTLLHVILAEHARLSSASARLFEDVLPTIEALRQGGYSIALVTNGASDIQRTALENVGLSSAFDFVAVSSEVGAVKPDPRIFHRVLDELGVEAGQAWHVGDNLQTDVLGASNAGLSGIWVNRRGHLRTEDDPLPVAEIESIGGLTDVLRQAG